MKRLNHIFHFNHLDLLGLGVALFCFTLNSLWVLPFLVFYVIKVRRMISVMLYVLIVLLISLGYYILSTESIPSEVSHQAQVVKVDHYDSYDRIVLKIQRKKYIAYTSLEKFQVGDAFYVEAQVTCFPKETTPLGFNAKEYYLSKGISGKLKIIDIGEIKHKANIYTLREKIVDEYESLDLSPYVYLMMFGIDMSEETEDSFQSLGILHLLSLSGIHLYILVVVIKKIFYVLNVPNMIQKIAVIGIYLMFSYLHRFDLGVNRLLIMAILLFINEYFELRKSPLELIQVTFFCLILFDYHNLMSKELFMIYIIITGLRLLEPLYRRYHGFIKRCVMGWIVFLILLPFQNAFNVLQIILLPLLSYPLAGAFMLGSFLVFILPELNPVLSELFMVIEEILFLLESFSYPVVTGSQEGFMVVIYFVFWILILISQSITKRSMLGLLGIFLFIVFRLININDTSITFLDVGQGDSTIIKSNGCVAVIDAYQGINNYIKNHGIQKIDYLILTHSDYDHISEAEDLIKTFRVDYLVLSSEDSGYPPYKKKKLYAKSGDIFTCGKVKLNVLAPLGESQSTNDSSIVIQTKIGEYTFLLTGDIEKESENKLIETYGKKLKSDVLKVSHHGSLTSTSPSFLALVDPKIAVISVGRDNKYAFPHDEVIRRLNKEYIVIYRTDMHGTIIYNPTKKKVKWQFYLPF